MGDCPKTHFRHLIIPICTRFRVKSLKVAPLHLTLLLEIWHKLEMPVNEKQFLDSLRETVS